MKRIVFAVALVCLMATPCFALNVIFEQVIAVTSGTTVIVNVPDSIQGGLIQVSRGGACRMTFGSNPVSSTKGIYMSLYGTYECKTRGEMISAQFTADSGNAGSGASIYVIGYDYRDR